jgi:integrase
MRQAHAKKQDIMAPINQGKFILQAQIRFHDLVAKYQEARLPKLGSATRDKYGTHIANHILPVFGRTELGDLDRQSIEAWLAREAQPHRHGEAEYQGLGWWTLTDLKSILSAIFSAAADWGLWQGENPCARVQLGQKVEKREKRIPGAADLQRFLDALPDTCILPAEVVRLVVLTACVAGLRISDVLALAPEDVNPLTGTLRVTKRWYRGEFGPTKSGHRAVFGRSARSLHCLPKSRERSNTRRPLAAQWAGHYCFPQRRERSLDHAPDWPPQRADGAPLHSRRLSVSRQREHEARPLNRSTTRRVNLIPSPVPRMPQSRFCGGVCVLGS